jgi:tRNA-uridine 2-sulfurtransferase
MSLNVIVAMSGGVDSSVAAALLHEQGHKVLGVTLKLLPGKTPFGCCGSTRDIEDARSFCAALGVPHYVLDLSDTFKKDVMDPFVRSYLGGETPNPCIACNRFIKFGALFEKAKALGADAVATGHYARVIEERAGDRPVFSLRRGMDKHKDQSYVLYHLTQKELAHILLPVGEMEKSRVRDMARRYHVKVAEKPDSQEICFVPPGKTAEYVRAAGVDAPTLHPGDIRDTSGKVLGEHPGTAYFTRGQREGLGLSVGKPLYVVDVDAAANTLIVGDDADTGTARFQVRDVSWTWDAPPSDSFDAHVQIRSRHGAAPCRVAVAAAGARVETLTPQRAVTPGQSAVFYDGDRVIGGGVISRTR